MESSHSRETVFPGDNHFYISCWLYFQQQWKDWAEAQAILSSVCTTYPQLSVVKSTSVHITQNLPEVLWRKKAFWHFSFHSMEWQIYCCLKTQRKNTFLKPARKSLPPTIKDTNNYKIFYLSSYNRQCLSSTILLLSTPYTWVHACNYNYISQPQVTDTQTS